MGVQLSAASAQSIQAAWARSAPQPMTFMVWARSALTDGQIGSIICAGDIDAELSFNALQHVTIDTDRSNAISFEPYAEANGATIPSTGAHFVAAVFGSSSIIIDIDGTRVTQAWSPSGSVSWDRLGIGRTLSTIADEYFSGIIEHAAIWSAALTTTQLDALRTLTSAPSDISGLVAYFPFKNNLTDSVGSLSWTAYNLSSPTYVDLGINYASGYSYVGSGTLQLSGSANTSCQDTTTRIYQGNGSVSFSGEATTQQTEIDYVYSGSGILGLSGKAVYSFATTYPRIIDHTNFNASSKTNAQITAAATLKVYFEHASTGQDIVGNSTTNSSTGNNNDDTELCGLAELYAIDNRYLCSRSFFTSSNDYTWFADHTGLQNNQRGNPAPATKVSEFMNMSANMRGAIQIGMWKYCWIDVWTDTPGYISDGVSAANSDISDMEEFETANPNITLVYWTMPLQSNESYVARQNYNDTIRTYCKGHSKYLIDIADIECHNPSGNKQVDGNNREIMYSTYAQPDGGHLASAGRIRMANAYWSMMAQIAENIGTFAYQGNGIVSLSGNAVISYQDTTSYSYSGNGSVKLEGNANVSYQDTTSYSYSGNGSATLLGNAVVSYQDSTSYHYSGNGVLQLNGSAVISYQDNSLYAYRGDGSILLNGNAVTSHQDTTSFNYQGNGTINLIGNGHIAQISQYNGIGTITFAGGASTSKYAPCYNYNGTGYLQLYGTALTSRTSSLGHGLWQMTFSLKKPSMGFTSKKASITMGG